MRIPGFVLLGLVAAGFVWTPPIFDGFAPDRIDRPAPAGPRSERPSGDVSRRRVILISIDGLAPWVLEKSEAPNLARLAREGVAADLAETVVPSITLTSHTSMITGVPPERHGVDWNSYLPWRHIRVPTIFTRCGEEGLRCGLFAGKRKFAHYAEDEPGVMRYAHGGTAEEVLALALAWLRESDPDFVMIHLAEVDAAGHADGWGSASQRAAVTRVDADLGAFVVAARAASPRRLVVIVTADHGGHGTNHGSAAPEDVDIPWLAWGDGLTAGAQVAHVSTMDTGPTVLSLLGVAPLVGVAGRARLGTNLVDLALVDPSIEVDMRYATPDNFLHEAVYPANRCLLTADAAERLARVQRRLAKAEVRVGLRVWDCYRPTSVQQTMWALVPDPRYVADPREGSKHGRGSAVDVALAGPGGTLVELPTAFDDFTPRAHRDFTALPEAALRNRRLLEDTMTAEGFVPLPTEWWHFDDPGWRDAPLRNEPIVP